MAFHWLTSEYMQLVIGFMQLSAAGGRCNIVYFHCPFEGKKVNSVLQWGISYSKFSFGEVYHWIYVWISRFTALLARCR